jgi:phosphoglucosamine mutase
MDRSTWHTLSLLLIISSYPHFDGSPFKMAKLFGTDGMRGEAGKFPMDAATVETVGASLATHLKSKLGRAPVVLIGRDTRESGEWLEKALVAGIRKAGAASKSAGVITTPGVAYLARTLPTDAGIVISASHNAYRDNGIKIFASSGRKLDEATERLIERDILSTSERVATTSTSESIPTSVLSGEQSELRDRYLNFLAGEIGRGMSLNGIRLVIDCANGAASTVAPALFERLGASVVTINHKPDGRNINFNCGSLHMESLQHRVVQHKADLGVAVDGDADRSLFVDSEGRLINGDASLWVLGKYLQAKGQLHSDTVVATVMSNIGLEIAFRSLGIRLVRTDVGDKYVLDELLKLGANLGGEQSGHIIFPQLSLAGDGLITTLCMLRAMTEAGKSLQELAAGFQTFPQILVNVEVRMKKPFAEVESIQDAARKIENELGSRGRLLLRYSGTEPLARVMLEGESQDEIEEYADELAGVIRKSLGT